MKIALIGYGKMGKAIEEVALQNGHEVVLKISTANAAELTEESLRQADVAIEFTNPESAVENLLKCFAAGVPVVCGSTGWLAKWDDVTTACDTSNGALLYASNFSIGVNLFFQLNDYLAGLMQGFHQYNVGMEEIHHTQKKDAPSGTAITLAEQIMAHISTKKIWVNHAAAHTSELSVISRRIDPAAGTHIVKYTSTIDDIEIIHTAHSRTGFATGAMAAATFMAGKSGLYTMKDVLNL